MIDTWWFNAFSVLTVQSGSHLQIRDVMQCNVPPIPPPVGTNDSKTMKTMPTNYSPIDYHNIIQSADPGIYVFSCIHCVVFTVYSLCIFQSGYFQTDLLMFLSLYLCPRALSTRQHTPSLTQHAPSNMLRWQKTWWIPICRIWTISPTVLMGKCTISGPSESMYIVRVDQIAPLRTRSSSTRSTVIVRETMVSHSTSTLNVPMFMIDHRPPMCPIRYTINRCTQSVEGQSHHKLSAWRRLPISQSRGHPMRLHRVRRVHRLTQCNHKVLTVSKPLKFHLFLLSLTTAHLITSIQINNIRIIMNPMTMSKNRALNPMSFMRTNWMSPVGIWSIPIPPIPPIRRARPPILRSLYL